jgi:hypothetical protein
MSGRLYVSIAIVLILYLGYCWYMYDPSFAFRVSTASAVTSTVPTQPLPPPPLMEKIQSEVSMAAQQRQNTLEGMDNMPKTPPMQPLLEPKVKASPPKEEMPFDKDESTYESAQIPERLRHPERSFSPGLLNDETEGAVASGIASYSAGVTRKAEQSFGPEFVQNGGQFMSGVVANDDSMAVSYSGF